MNEEQRQKLRRLEVALIEYRESLEERGIKNLEEIEKKVQLHRKRLQAEYGLSDSGEDGQGNRRTSSERRDRHDVSRKRHHSRSPSGSPQPKLSGKDRDREYDLERDRSYDFDSQRGRDQHQEKSGRRERDDHDKDRGRDRERDRRRQTK